MKKFQKALFKGSFNPLQAGHLYLLDTARDICEKTDIYVGNKKRPNLLPRSIRAKAINKNIKSNNWQEHFNIISTKKHYDLIPEKYDLFITGSDLLNIITKKISCRGIEIPQKYKDFYLRFPNILILDRIGQPLEKDAKKKLEYYTNVTYGKCPIKISGSEIRQAYQAGKDISKLISGPTWKIVKNYAHFFKETKRHN
jgi:nicotinic acid mononucleotide adenylyltransferase